MTPMQALPTAEIRDIIRDLVNDRGADLVQAYYSDQRFAGSLFVDFGSNPPDSFTADDVVAASLLDVRFGPPAVRDLLERGTANTLLEAVPTDWTLWGEETDLSRGSVAWQLWELLLDLPDVAGTRASKLLARKRPHLFPILDSVIRARLGLGELDAWATLREVLQHEQLRELINTLGDGLDGRPRPSTLRLLDVVTWMRFSESTPARDVRRALAFEVAERQLTNQPARAE